MLDSAGSILIILQLTLPTFCAVIISSRRRADIDVSCPRQRLHADDCPQP